jgi:hypothetical protein
VFPFFVDYFNTMACYVHPARLPVGHGFDLNQPTKCDGQTKNRKRKPKKGNDKISSKSQKKTTGGARTPSDRSARDSVQAHRQTCDISQSVPRKELTMADGSIADTFLNSQMSLHPHRPCQVLHPTNPAPMMKAICQVLPPTTSAPMTNTIKMKRVTTMLQQKMAKPKT